MIHLIICAQYLPSSDRDIYLVLDADTLDDAIALTQTELRSLNNDSELDAMIFDPAGVERDRCASFTDIDDARAFLVDQELTPDDEPLNKLVYYVW